MFKKNQEAGQAQIVARQTHEGQFRKGVNVYAPFGPYHHVYDYVADVVPDSGTPVFRATFTELFAGDGARTPHVGEQVRVLFDPGRQRVEFDRDVLREEGKASEAASKEQFDAIADAAPAAVVGLREPEPIGPAGRDAAAGAAEPPQKTVESLLRVSLRQAQRKGDAAEVERLTAKLAELQNGNDGAPSAEPSDRLGRLQKLADLHDHGVLTDAEFATEKAKILRES